VNVAGFVPMGFFFTAYFSLVRPMRRPRIAVVAMGLAVSLTIEMGQYFLPTRDSGINDLITSTLGTEFGAVLCSPTSIRRIASKLLSFTNAPVLS
jgi:glycopeptide antibiotics resistance protein